MLRLGFVFALCFAVVQVGLSTEILYSRAVVESCSGCQLNRLPDVKQFIFDDVPKYENVIFKHIGGAPPELVLYNEDGEETERLKLAKLTRQECNDLLVQKGFFKKPVKDEI